MKNCNLQAIVNEFTTGHAHPEEITPTPATSLSGDKKSFIRQMILDELNEFDEATTLEGEVDALVDLVYYVADFCNRMRLPFDQVFDAVHAANMRKLVRDENRNVLRETDGPRKGKILKPANWVGPDNEISTIIAAARGKETKND
jgi:predicted HAD superfamily Cof-like phosphohydrolase